MSETLERNILLVDDELIIGMATKQKLAKIGYSVTVASQGKHAMEIINTKDDISLVLMDIDLGNGQNGIDICREIINRKNIPIVFVSSHTEPEVVSLTEQVTSYGYIVKSSSITVYDASIKMAYKLFNERRNKDKYSKYLFTALNNATEPIFISDLNGDVVFFNIAYLSIQGLNDPSQIQNKFSEYSKIITVYSSDGTLLEKNDWASTRGLRGLSGDDVVFYVYQHRIQKILINLFTYAPIYGDANEIIGSYVKIIGKVENPDPTIIKKIIKDLNLTIQ